ncbi:MAG TPA: methyl-accepting chemotaxis protein [Acidobacteriaceae bacterium]|jgi:methyl-accepting chemotaxis protein|nr:methyl-accepting chemotaxis protein [Acidobacteriaceae bacterium]
MKNSTFSRKLAYSFAVVVLLAVAAALISSYANSRVVAAKDHVIEVNARALASAEQLDAALYARSAAIRGYLLTGSQQFLNRIDTSNTGFSTTIGDLQRILQDPNARASIDQIQQSDSDFRTQLQREIQMKQQGASMQQLGQYMLENAQPARSREESLVDQFSVFERHDLDEGQRAATELAGTYRLVVIAITVLVIVLALILGALLSRLLTGQIGSAVQDIQSSAAELQTTATEQATGAREQATAMSEITTTMNELLATSRQIAGSAQRVSSIATETANSARNGDQVVRKAHDSIAGIKRQVDQVVGHMLELGRKSQQIGGVIEIISELSEQTNILAINANIEAADAGESGRRFAVVADEIRKLADRVAGSTKDIRSLIDDVRAAVNSTVMATETGSKAVDAGTRDFGDLAVSLSQMVSLAGTASEAAREIELSTKQQSTAVEQVNGAVANVAQVSREAESSTTQAMQTAAELATLSRRLTQLIRSEAGA